MLKKVKKIKDKQEKKALKSQSPTTRPSTRKRFFATKSAKKTSFKVPEPIPQPEVIEETKTIPENTFLNELDLEYINIEDSFD